jgi:hypothetical protein
MLGCLGKVPPNRSQGHVTDYIIQHKFTGSTVIDMDSAINTSYNHVIKVLSCKSDLNRYIDSYQSLVMSKSLHSMEGVQVDTV